MVINFTYFSIYNFNHSYNEKQNLDWHVGLYICYKWLPEDDTSVLKHVGGDMSLMVYHCMHMTDDILTVIHAKYE